MMTRGQVARRLGKSVATVRRLEGSLLHPRRDASGVLRFNPTEVDRVARGMRQGNLRPPLSSFRTDEFESDNDEDEALDPEEIEHRAKLQRYEAETNAAAEARRAERLRLEQEEERRRAAETLELQRYATRQLSDLSRLLETCSPRELRMLSRDPELSALLKALARDL